MKDGRVNRDPAGSITGHHGDSRCVKNIIQQPFQLPGIEFLRRTNCFELPLSRETRKGIPC